MSKLVLDFKISLRVFWKASLKYVINNSEKYLKVVLCVDFTRLLWKIFQSCLMRQFYSAIFKNYCENYRMIQDFSTQFSLLYLHTKIVTNTEHPIYYLGCLVHQRAYHFFPMQSYRNFFSWTGCHRFLYLKPCRKISYIIPYVHVL